MTKGIMDIDAFSMLSALTSVFLAYYAGLALKKKKKEIKFKKTIKLFEDLYELFLDIDKFLKGIDYLNRSVNYSNDNDKIDFFSFQIRMFSYRIKILKNDDLRRHIEICYNSIQKKMGYPEQINTPDFGTVLTHQSKHFAERCKEDVIFYDRLKNSVSEILRICVEEQERLYNE